MREKKHKAQNALNPIIIVGGVGILGSLYFLNKNDSSTNENEIALAFQAPIEATQGQKTLQFTLTQAEYAVITSNKYLTQGVSLEGISDYQLRTLLSLPTIQAYLNSIKPVFTLKDISAGVNNNNMVHLTLQNIQTTSVGGVNKIVITFSESIPFGIAFAPSYITLNFTGNQVNELIEIIGKASPELVGPGKIIGDIKSAMDPKI